MDLGVGSISPFAAGPVTTGRPASEARDNDSQEAQPKAGTKPQTVGRQLSTADQQVVAELQSIDRAVRTHEGAHKAVGGALAGGASFSYQTGPDGRRYAVGGEVSIDTGAERDPRATIAKMQRVIAAALAPGDPSAQDRAVAAQARATMAAAQQLLGQQPDRPADRLAKAYQPEEDPTGALVDTTA